MKELNEIIRGVEVLSRKGPDTSLVSGIAFDSRIVAKGFLFMAVRGTVNDGHNYIRDVILSGAGVIVCEIMPEKTEQHVTYIQVPDSSIALGVIASNWFGNPSRKLRLIGITGTNGKTTSVTLLHNLFRLLGYSTGLLSTIINKIDEEEIPSTHTTPDAIRLNELLDRMVSRGCRYCFMEVSSHAIAQNRISGLTFAGGVFSNITHDHLDFHKTFDEYLRAKKRFFDELPASAFALTNIDDRNGRVMVQNSAARKKTYSLLTLADFKGRIIEAPLDGLQMEFDGKDTWCRLVGHFNGYNLLAVYATALLLGEDQDEVLRILSSLEAAEGRFEYVKSPDGKIAIVDYAHTPDALKNVLETIMHLRTGNESLITVIGCGGDRDRVKRPVMARIACQFSDTVILTSDNPRSEDPDTIISEMFTGVDTDQLKKVIKIRDRKEAIQTACHISRAKDVILVAGKGHEKYQEIAGIRYPFDDKKVVEELLIQK